LIPADLSMTVCYASALLSSGHVFTAGGEEAVVE
jgi:hypothetical protein